MLKILLCLQKKKKKIRNITILHFFYYSQLFPFYTGRTIRSIVSTEKVESIHLFMNEKYLARVNRERSWSSPWGGCPCFPLPPFPFPSIFARIPLSLSLSPPPLSLARNLSPVARSSEWNSIGRYRCHSSTKYARK